MLNQLRQVIVTYTTRWYFWLGGLYVVLMHAWWLWNERAWTHLSAVQALAGTLTVLPLTIGVLGILVGSQLRTQFANPRARLLPGFAAAHLVVAGVILAVAVVAHACVIAWAENVSALAVASIALVVVALAAWVGCIVRREFVIFFVILLLAGRYISKYLAAEITNGNPIVFLATASVGLAGLAALVARLLKPAADVPWRAQLSTPSWGSMLRAGTQCHQWEAQAAARSWKLIWLRDLEFRLVFRGAIISRPPRGLLLRQLVSGFPGVVWALVQFGFVLFFLSRLHQIPWPLGTGDPQLVRWLSILLTPFLFASLALNSILLQRWPYMARESLYPVTRANFVRALLCTTACDVAIAAAGHCAGIVVGLLPFASPEMLTALMPTCLLTLMALYLVLYSLMV